MRSSVSEIFIIFISKHKKNKGVGIRKFPFMIKFDFVNHVREREREVYICLQGGDVC